MTGLVETLRKRSVYVIAIIIVAAIILTLRSFNAATQTSLIDVRSTSVTLQSSQDGEIAPLLNETAPARSIELRGFEIVVDRSAQGAVRQDVQKLADQVVMLQRTDQLHIKDLYIRSGGRITMSYGSGILGLSVDGEESCCWGRIGVGTSVKIERPETQIAPEVDSIDPSSPNLAIVCQLPPCSIAVTLQSSSVDNLVEDWPTMSLGFMRPGTDSITQAGGESAILGGTIKVDAVDLLKNNFGLRKLVLPQGTAIVPAPGAHAHVSIDIRDDVLVVNSVLKNASQFDIRYRDGETNDILPTLLEVLIREPWRPDLVAIVLTAVPFLVRYCAPFVLIHRRKKRGSDAK